jgi:hypothetical protein
MRAISVLPIEEDNALGLAGTAAASAGTFLGGEEVR